VEPFRIHVADEVARRSAGTVADNPSSSPRLQTWSVIPLSMARVHRIVLLEIALRTLVGEGPGAPSKANVDSEWQLGVAVVTSRLHQQPCPIRPFPFSGSGETSPPGSNLDLAGHEDRNGIKVPLIAQCGVAGR
jgi:hypothetical protein